MGKCTLGCLKLSPRAILAYFSLLNILMYMDRGALAALITALEDDPDLRLSSTDAGVLGSVFMFGFMIASPIFANASQTIHPFTLISIGVSIWSGSELLAAVSRSFWMLVLARSLSGIGEASFVCLAAPIILSKAPADKKNLWISIFYSALTTGFALGYAIATPIKNGFGGWYYVFYIEMILSIPFIVIAIFAFRDPSLMFKKESKVDLVTQFKKLSKNTVYVFLVLGYGAYQFTVGGLSFWGPTILQQEYDVSEGTAAFCLGAITIVSGLVATVIGSQMLERTIKPFRLEYEANKITQKKYSNYITEKGSKLITRFVLISSIFSITGAIFAVQIPGSRSKGPFGFFLLCIAIGEFILFLGIGPTNMSLMNSVEEELRPQAVAVSIFFMHLLGDFPSPFFIGLLNDVVSMYFATCVLSGWLIFAGLFWFIAFNIARFHGAPKEYILKNFCQFNIDKQEDDRRLLTEEREVHENHSLEYQNA